MSQKTSLQRVDIEQQARGVAASQATTIEQSRAVAQVKAAAVMAKQAPRDEIRARQRILEACNQSELADRAFWTIPRAGKELTGSSIHLAIEVALLWGNIDYGIDELSRDDAKGESEMVAYAWDLETNTRHRMSFISPHKKVASGQLKPLIDLTAIYENNASLGARRLRECIWRVIPSYIRYAAEDACRATQNSQEKGIPLIERIDAMVSAYEGLGVTKEMIEKRAGKRISSFSIQNVNQFKILHRSLSNNEISKEEAFELDTASDLKKGLDQAATGEAQNTQKPQQQKSSPRTTRPAAAASGEGKQTGSSVSDSQSVDDEPSPSSSDAPHDEDPFPGDSPVVDFASVKAWIEDAADMQSAEKVYDNHEDFIKTLPFDSQQLLGRLVNEKE